MESTKATTNNQNIASKPSVTSGGSVWPAFCAGEKNSSGRGLGEFSFCWLVAWVLPLDVANYIQLLIISFS